MSDCRQFGWKVRLEVSFAFLCVLTIVLFYFFVIKGGAWWSPGARNPEVQNWDCTSFFVVFFGAVFGEFLRVLESILMDLGSNLAVNLGAFSDQKVHRFFN